MHREYIKHDVYCVTDHYKVGQDWFNGCKKLLTQKMEV